MTRAQLNALVRKYGVQRVRAYLLALAHPKLRRQSPSPAQHRAATAAALRRPPVKAALPSAAASDLAAVQEAVSLAKTAVGAAPTAAPLLAAAPIAIPLGAVGAIVASIAGAKSQEQLLAEAAAAGKAAIDAAGAAGATTSVGDAPVFVRGQRGRPAL